MSTLNPPNTKEPKQTALKILCLGDSLTEGYSQFGTKFTPYSAAMKIVLEKRWPGRKIVVDTDGMSGDLVTAPGGSFEKRGRGWFPSTPPITHTILLGGTNDFAYIRSPELIFSTLGTIADVALSNGSKVLFLTVPECKAKPKFLVEARAELNRFLLEAGGKGIDEGGEGTGKRKEGVTTFDLAKRMPYHSMPFAERVRIWDDGLHFTESGYAVIGDWIGEELVQVIEQEDATREREGEY